MEAPLRPWRDHYLVITMHTYYYFLLFASFLTSLGQMTFFCSISLLLPQFH